MLKKESDKENMEVLFKLNPKSKKMNILFNYDEGKIHLNRHCLFPFLLVFIFNHDENDFSDRNDKTQMPKRDS